MLPQVLGWRRVPTDHSLLGESAVRTEPIIEQVFITRATSEAALKLRLEQQVRAEQQQRGGGAGKGNLGAWPSGSGGGG